MNDHWKCWLKFIEASRPSDEEMEAMMLKLSTTRAATNHHKKILQRKYRSWGWKGVVKEQLRGQTMTPNRSLRDSP